MCGICGIVDTEGIPDNASDILNRMTAALSHRGPDDSGIRFNEGSEIPFTGFGHTRLSIIDLSETGHQPMSDRDENVWIIYNGEIYNFPHLKKELEKAGHVFRSSSDTEVIIHGYLEWGESVFSKLDGMFGLALYDARNGAERVMLAIDHAGIKPLYYSFDGRHLIFGSEIKALLGSNLIEKDLDTEGLLQYLALGYIPAPLSIYKRIRKLPPASLLTLRGSEITIRQYWKYPDKTQNTGNGFFSESELVLELRSLMQKAVERHLLSDVPVGVLLSGGIDSSAVVALIHELGLPPVQTFSVGFKGMGYYDERPYARMVADRFNSDHREIEIKPDVSGLLPVLVHHFDEPFADSSAVPTYYIAEFCRQYVKVILSGTGADDIFGGYRRYAVNRLVNNLRIMPSPLLGWVAAASGMFPVSRKKKMLEYFLHWKRLVKAAAHDGAGRYSSLMYIFNPEEFVHLLSADQQAESFNCPLEKFFEQSNGNDFLSRIMYVDYNTYLPGDLLVKEDRMSMAVGLEGRVPFLDKDLVEFAAMLPADLKLKRYTTKYLMKKAVTDILPEEVLTRPKHGFALPLGEWFKGPLSGTIMEKLRTRPSGIFNYDYIERIKDEHGKGREDHSNRLWSWLFFESWYERNF